MKSVSVALQAGVGRISTEGTVLGVTVSGSEINVPIGVGFAFSVPTPGVSIEPWVAPRIQISRVSLDVAGFSGSETNTDFGISGGVNIGLATGIGIHAALDVLGVSGATPVTFGIGLHYTFKLPNAPMVPGI